MWSEIKRSSVPGIMMAVILVVVMAGASNQVSAEGEVIGADEYRASCRNCHGPDGRGNGPLAQFFTIKPTNLTQIAKKNDGIFPTLEVFQIIDGRTAVAPHGDSAMPVWGSRYKKEAGEKYGPYGGELAVRARILELVFYLESIQKR